MSSATRREKFSLSCSSRSFARVVDPRLDRRRRLSERQHLAGEALRRAARGLQRPLRQRGKLGELLLDGLGDGAGKRFAAGVAERRGACRDDGADGIAGALRRLVRRLAYPDQRLDELRPGARRDLRRRLVRFRRRLAETAQLFVGAGDAAVNAREQGVERLALPGDAAFRLADPRRRRGCRGFDLANHRRERLCGLPAAFGLGLDAGQSGWKLLAKLGSDVAQRAEQRIGTAAERTGPRLAAAELRLEFGGSAAQRRDAAGELLRLAATCRRRRRQSLFKRVDILHQPRDECTAAGVVGGEGCGYRFRLGGKARGVSGDAPRRGFHLFGHRHEAGEGGAGLRRLSLGRRQRCREGRLQLVADRGQ
jgi:hypothetical protein